MHRPILRYVIVTLLLLTLTSTGCSFRRRLPPQETPAGQATSDKLHVVASFYPLAYFATQIGGDRAEVSMLVPGGSDPHDWEPTAATVRTVAQADLLVYNGAGLEPWVERLVATAENPHLRQVAATDGMALLPAWAGPGQHDADDGDHGHGLYDPHVWLDPVLAKAQVTTIAAAMSAADPDGAAVYEVHAARLERALTQLDRNYAELTACPRQTVIVTHPYFAYPATRYRLTQVAISGSGGHEAEPRPGALAALADHIRREGITHIFAERVDDRIARTLAAEAGATVLLLHPLESLTADDVAANKDYVQLLEDNLANLRLGLGCD